MMALTTSKIVGTIAEAECLCCFPSVSLGSKTAIVEEAKKIQDQTGRPLGANLNLIPHFGDGPSPEERLNWLLDAGVPIRETSGGNPVPFRETIRSAGVKHIHKIGRVRDAIKAEQAGVDKGMYPFGQVMGRIHDTPKVRELVHRILAGTREGIARLNGLQ